MVNAAKTPSTTVVEAKEPPGRRTRPRPAQPKPKGAPPQRKGPPKPSEAMAEVAEIEKFHQEEAIGLASWSVKTRRFLYKVLVGVALLLPLAPSILLIVFLKQHPDIGGRFYKLVSHNRASTQVIVAIIVIILSTLNVFIFSNLFRAFEVKLADNKFFALLLDSFGAGGGEIDDEKVEKVFNQATKWWKTRYSFKTFAIGLLAFGLFSAPHLVWTGALTPVDSSKVLTSDQNTYKTYAPAFSPETASNWANSSKHSPVECSAGFQSLALFTGCPTTSQPGNLFDAMSSASYLSLNETDDDYYPFAAQVKDEYSSYLYLGRSYGVGSSVGLAQNTVSQYPEDLLAYSYKETGYKTTVSCQRNDSSAWVLERVQGNTDPGVPSLFRAVGRFNNSDWSEGAGNETSSSTVLAQNMEDVVIWGVKSTPQGQHGYEHVLAIAAGANYSYLDKVQCRVEFAPTSFNVNVYINSTITVLPPTDAAAAAASGSFDADGGLALTASAQLALLSSLQESPYSSRLGEALKKNLGVRQYVDDRSGSGGGDELSQSLTAVADSVAAVADGILVYVASSQYYLDSGNSSTTTATTSITVGAVSLGDPVYVYLAIIGTSALVVLIVAKEIFLAATDRKTFYTTNDEWTARVRERLEKAAAAKKARAPAVGEALKPETTASDTP